MSKVCSLCPTVNLAGFGGEFCDAQDSSGRFTKVRVTPSLVITTVQRSRARTRTRDVRRIRADSANRSRAQHVNCSVIFGLKTVI